MNFRVKCIDASGSMGLLKAGEVYTVTGRGSLNDGTPTFLLAEQPHPNRDCGWMQKRFRRAVERKTSIDVFTAMLAPEPNQGVKAPQKSKERV